jgi:hypothetical protein
MKVFAEVTETKKTLVEVTPEDLIRVIETKMVARGYKRVNKKLLPGEVWGKYSYTHPHNGDDIYEPCEAPTEEEKFWYRFFDELETALRG